MASPQPAPQVKLFAAVLHAPEADPADCLRRLEGAFSPCEHRGVARAFDCTDYYAEEMGPALLRSIVGFRDLQPASALPQAKQRANAIESELARHGRRRFNIDVGYLDLHKVVLASCKGRGSKVYLHDGVWADVTLRYRAGRWEPLPWSFPDFRDGRYDVDFLHLRALLKAQLRLISAPDAD
ncbi:MAG: DUF4416 family protein [Candidatus Lambdaproteobacteria bacterium]|nr:DUF4416 family protein [Candidatus Lambdaproteobacteria bacterium]